MVEHIAVNDSEIMGEVETSELDEAELTDLRETRGSAGVSYIFPNFLEMDVPNGQCLTFSVGTVFQLGDTSWVLEIYPNGENERSSRWVSVFLRRGTGTTHCTMSYNLLLFVDGVLHQELHGKFKYHKQETRLGRNRFIKRSVISDIVGGDMAVFWGYLVKVEFSCCLLKGDPASEDSLRDIGHLTKDLNDLCLGGRRTDVKLQVQGREFQAHKLVLAARSPVFDAMFDTETDENKSGVVDIPDLNPDSFQDFLLFIYTGNLDLLTPANAPEFYKAGNKYGITDIVKECRSRLDEDNILDFVLLAETHEDPGMAFDASKYFVSNAKDIFSTTKWETFMGKNPQMANNLLKDLKL